MTDLLQTIDNTEIICTAIVCACFVLVALIVTIGVNIYNYLENKACYENELKIKKIQQLQQEINNLKTGVNSNDR